ncbi:MAG: SprB repeat-containing protein [Bacteroidales bacterium]|nr:SprB repeat-containing protein [Bacteroidales bacterium]
MKNIHLSLKIALILCFIVQPSFVFTALTQIKLGSSNFPKAGTNFIYAKVKLYPEKKIRLNDLGRENWDISGFAPESFDTLRLMLPEKTKYGKRFPDAQLAIVTNPLKIDYLCMDSSKVYHVGLIGDFMETNIPVLLRFEDSLIFLNDEKNINKIYSDNTGSKFVAPYYYKPGTDSIRADIVYEYEGRIDAEAYLKTPLGRFYTLREVLFVHKQVRGYKYSVFGWTPAPEYSLDKRFVVYRWYFADNSMPLAEVYVNKKDYIEEIRYQYDSPMRLSFSAKHVSCKGGNNGSIDLSVQGGIPDYTYEWSTGDTTQDLDNLRAGTYNVTVIDNKGRKISGAYTLTEPLVALNAVFDIKNVSCYGANDGAVSLNINGGQEPYDFVWSNDSTDFKMSNLRPGTYTVWIKDAGACIVKDSVVITQPAMKLRAIIEKEHVSCFKGSDGRLLAVCKGGTPPYHFLWSNGDTTYAAENLPAGAYSVLITDAHGCSYHAEAAVKQPQSALKLNSEIKPVNCYGGSDGSFKLSAQGGKPGYIYLLPDSTRGKSLRDIPSGYYNVKVIDANECVQAERIFIPQPEKPLNVQHNKTDVSCYGLNNGTINLNVSGGTKPYIFNWSNGSDKKNLKKLPGGIYSVIITDKNKCVVNDTIEIKAPKKALFIDFEKTDIICHGGNSGKIKLIIEGGTPGYSVLWANKNTNKELTGLKAGKYLVTVSDKNNCTAKREIILTEPKEPLRINVEKIDPLCYGQKSGSIYTSVSGGIPPYDYDWSSGEHAQNLIGLSAGKYTLKLSDKLGCEKIEIIKLNEPAKLEVKANVINTKKGEANGSITLTVTGGTKPYNVFWENKQNTTERKNLRKGYYYVTIVDANECEIDLQFEIKEED